MTDDIIALIEAVQIVDNDNVDIAKQEAKVMGSISWRTRMSMHDLRLHDALDAVLIRLRHLERRT